MTSPRIFRPYQRRRVVLGWECSFAAPDQRSHRLRLMRVLADGHSRICLVDTRRYRGSQLKIDLYLVPRWDGKSAPRLARCGRRDRRIRVGRMSVVASLWHGHGELHLDASVMLLPRPR